MESIAIPERRSTSAIPERKWILSAAEKENVTPDNVLEAKIQMLIKFY